MDAAFIALIGPAALRRPRRVRVWLAAGLALALLAATVSDDLGRADDDGRSRAARSPGGLAPCLVVCLAPVALELAFSR
jgi:hypothetical protein